MMRWFKRARERQSERLSAYLDERLSPRERAETEALLAQSAEARAELAALRVTLQALRQAPRLQARRSFAVRPESIEAARPPRPGWVRLTPVLSGAAALFLVMTLVGGALDLFSQQPLASRPEATDSQAFTAKSAEPPPSAAATSAPAATATPAGTTAPTAEVPRAAQGPSTALQSQTPAPAATPAPTAAPQPTSAPVVGTGGGTTDGRDSQGATPPAVVPEPASHFPWLPLQVAAGALTAIISALTFWVFRARARA